jgi:hypothetical protein
MSSPTETKKPATHYDLLKLKPLESDQAVIRKHFHKLVEQVRAQLAKEPGSEKWRKTLADMTKAMLVLSDTRRKADYDGTIGGRTEREKPQSMERIVRARKVIDDAALEKAKKFADTVNLDLHEAIINQKLAAADVVMPLFADSLGVPFVELADLEIDPELVPTVPAVMARQNSLTPVLKDEGAVVIASPKPLKPEIEEQLSLRFNAPIRAVICTKAAIDDAIGKYYPREAAAAQMNAVPQAPSSSSGTAGTPAAATSPKVGSSINKAELRKKKMKIAMVSGMMSFTFTVVFSSIMGWTAGTVFPAGVYLSAAVIGGIAAGVGYLVVNE